MISKGTIERKITMQGVVQEDERSISLVTSRFAGRIDQLEINFTGSEVRKGDVLAKIYSPELITAQRELLETVEIRSSNPKIYQAARNKLRLWDLSETQIESIENGGKPIELVEIISPTSGIVSDRSATLGEYIEEGSVLYRISDLRKLWLLFEAYEADLPMLRVGSEIVFTVNSLPDQKFSASISFINPVLDPKTRTVAVRVEVANNDLSLKPGMFANGLVTAKLSQSNLLLVPSTAVLWTGKRSVVYVSVPDTEIPVFEFREVNLGSELNGFYEIKEGLREGEIVVTNGAFKVDAAAQLAGKKSMMNRSIKREAQQQHRSNHKSVNGKELSFIVYGNCSMCKKRIEKAANAVSGVEHSNWNSDNKLLTIHTGNIELKKETVSEAIATVGHDTEYHNANDSVYESLPSCCKFDRPKQ
jgi:Cu(I)/Ag(I) efflux system membrane fusion protein